MRMLLGAMLLAFQCGSAIAGAFPRAEKESQIISTWLFNGSSVAFNAQGLLIPVTRYRVHEWSTLLEYGYDSETTLIFKTALQRVESAWLGPSSVSGFGHVEAGLLRRLAVYKDVSFSLQGLVRIPGSFDRRFALDKPGQAEARLAVGTPFSFFPDGFLTIKGFVETSGAWVRRSGAMPDEFRVDATLGLQSSERVMVLYQLFSAWGLQKSPWGGRPNSHKAQTSIVYSLTPDWRLQAGFFASFAGAHARYERGYLTALWRRF